MSTRRSSTSFCVAMQPDNKRKAPSHETRAKRDGAAALLDSSLMGSALILLLREGKLVQRDAQRAGRGLEGGLSPTVAGPAALVGLGADGALFPVGDGHEGGARDAEGGVVGADGVGAALAQGQVV